MGAKGRDGGRAIDNRPIDLNVDAERSKRRQIGRGESVEFVGGLLVRAIAAKELIIEEEADLGDGERASEQEGAEEVVDCVVPKRCEGDLRARDDDRLAGRWSDEDSLLGWDAPQVLEQEGQSRSGIGHRIGTVKDDESVVVTVVALDIGGHIEKRLDVDIRRVDQLLVLKNGVCEGFSTRCRL